MDEESGAAEGATAADEEEAFSKPGANWKEKGKWRCEETTCQNRSPSDKNSQ